MRPNRDKYGNWLPEVAAKRHAASKHEKARARGTVRRIVLRLEDNATTRKQVRGFRYALRGERLIRRVNQETGRNVVDGKRIAPNPPHLERMMTGDVARYLNIADGNMARRERRRLMREMGVGYRQIRKMARAA